VGLRQATLFTRFFTLSLQKIILNTKFNNALIGYTGFVGSNLVSQTAFTHTYNSTNFQDMAGRSYDVVVCAGVSAAKYLANREPVNDLQQIERLQDVLTSVRAGRCILISTIDVYNPPRQVIETDLPVLQDHHAYGAHRYMLERFVMNTFSDTMVFRLPGVFGTGLKKNVLFDLMHRSRLDEIDPAGVFQWYPVSRLWRDIEAAVAADIDLLNIAVEPLRTDELVRRFFPDVRLRTKNGITPVYDMWTMHAAKLGGSGNYLMEKETVLAELAGFLGQQSMANSSSSAANDE
jgi:hypothetical protein